MPYVSTRIGRWFYEERGGAGAGPAIVCLHGLLFDGGMWRNQLGPLAALGRVIVFDGPGHGKSEVPPLFTLGEHADALADALAELGVDASVLVGLSWGGMLAMRFAVRHATNTRGLALLDTSAERELPALRARFRAFATFHQYVGMPYSLYEREIAPRMFCRRTRERAPDLVSQTGRTLLGFNRRGVARAAMAVAVNRTDVLGSLPQISCPTLVLCGRDDRSTPVAKNENIASRIPGARFVVIEGAGHMTPLEQPDAVNAQLLPFIEGALTDARA
ncbi:MAG: alpha/beta hydrolase [Myxococcales bacterium]|nr:alpha/beta hydrolase [Myxococcales bacterium]HQY62328.1 alpha/beta hydrolase [Polyangiaceae bacterium]